MRVATYGEILWRKRFEKACDLARALKRTHRHLENGPLQAAREFQDLSDNGNRMYWAGQCVVAGRKMQVPSQATVDLTIELLDLAEELR